MTATGSILFFSGGSALKDVSRALAAVTSDTTHIISTFDSGGSTAELRRAFHMPAPGDLRLRLSTLSGCDYFERRLGEAGERELADFLAQTSVLPPSFRSLLELFIQLMPKGFNLHGAAIGNLILAADYLENGRSLYESTQRIASVLGAAGAVLPVSEDSAHLAVRLQDGSLLVGQHSFTGKGGQKLSAPISEMFFCRELDDTSPAKVRPGQGVLEAIAASDLICYPVGSFYSSVLGNLWVDGVGEAVRKSRAKKLYMPNPGRDPESATLSLEEQMDAICQAAGWQGDARGVIDFLLVDSKNASYRGGIPTGWCARHGVEIIDCPCVEADAAGLSVVSPQKISALLTRLSSTCHLA